MRLLPLLCMGLAACTCGELTYRGYAIDEHCGAVYGAQGKWYRGDGVVELSFPATTPISRTGISWGRYEPTFQIAFPDRYLRAGTPVPPEDIATRCRWTEIPRAGSESGRDVAHDGPATAVEVTVRGRGFNPDLNPLDRDRYQRFEWHLECTDGEIVVSGTDVVALEVEEHSSPWPTLSATGD